MRTKPLAIAIVLALFVSGISTNAQDMTKLQLVYKIPDMEKVQVQEGITYKTSFGTNLTMDIYYPPHVESTAKLPAVILVLGYPNGVFDTKLKDWQIYVSWGKLIAASGIVAINYETQQPTADIADLINYIRQNASSLKIDENRIGIWSCSANVLTASSILFGDRRDYLRCAVLYYGLLLTPDQTFRDSIVALTKQVKFSTDGTDRIKYLHNDLPLFVVRSGKDMEIFKKVADHFVATALSSDVPLTLINYTDGHHGFDMNDDNDRSRAIIKETLVFLKSNLFLNADADKKKEAR